VLHLEARSGTVTVEARALDRIQVDADIRIWSVSSDDADDAAAAVAAGMEQDGEQRVIVRAPALRDTAGGWSILKLGQRGSRVDYRVRVPLSSSVRVLSRSGRVEISGVHGRVHAEVLSGRCGIADVRGDVTVAARSGAVEVDRVDGTVNAEARSGRIRVANVTGDVIADSRSGAVEVDRVDGTVNAEARSGRIRVANVTGDVIADSRSGAVDLARIGGDVRITARSGAVSVEQAAAAMHVRSRCGVFRYRGAVCGDYDVEVETGPITLAVDPDRPFFVDAESRVGPVTSDLPPRRGGGAPAAGGAKVRLRTHTGPIRLTRD
jgi:hypothetical protein